MVMANAGFIGNWYRVKAISSGIAFLSEGDRPNLVRKWTEPSVLPVSNLTCHTAINLSFNIQ